MNVELKLDCRHYRGDRPCAFACRCTCEHYAPMGTRVLIIKVGAVGDVVRTGSILPTLHRVYDPVHVTWISEPSGVNILQHHPLIDCLLTFDAVGMRIAEQQTFDLVLSLDKDPGPAALCERVQAADKRGMGLSPHGTVYPINAACEPYFELGLDDDLKFHGNTKSYPQLIHEAVAMPYVREPYRLYCNEATLAATQARFAPWREGGAAVVGVNTGAGKVFANKTFTPDKWVEVCRRLLDDGHVVVLLGGPQEISNNRWIAERLDGRAYVAGNGHTAQQFTAMVDQCDVVVTADTLALHVAIGRDVPVVVLFGPTCEQEIDLFDHGRKIISPCDCRPCYRRACNVSPTCMDRIDIGDVVGAVSALLNAARTEGARP